MTNSTSNTIHFSDHKDITGCSSNAIGQQQQQQQQTQQHRISSNRNENYKTAATAVTPTTTTTMNHHHHEMHTNNYQLIEKAVEINLVLNEPEIDLWRLREFALTDGGLVNGTYRQTRPFTCFVLFSSF